MIVALDIETIPNADMVSRLPECECTDARIKDPAKIAAHIEEKKAKQVDRMALDPLYGRVCCVALVSPEKNDVRIITECNDEQEQGIIQSLMDTFSNPEIRLVTWNGNGFDLPFIYRRALALGVSPKHFGAPPLSTWTKKYNNDRHIDLMREWACGGTEFTKLDSVAAALLGAHKHDVDVTKFAEMMKTEEGRKEIADYCLQDTKLTYQIFERCLGTLFV